MDYEALLKYKSLEWLAQRIAELFNERIEGCVEEELRGIEQEFGRQLPPVYRNFLKTMGRQGADFFLDQSARYPDLIQFGKQGDDFIQDEEKRGFPVELSRDAFVFGFDRQGQGFNYFRADENSDPAVHVVFKGSENYPDNDQQETSSMTKMPPQILAPQKSRTRLAQPHFR